MAGSSYLIVRGVVGVTLGVLAMLWPGVTLTALVGIFGLYAILDGATNLFLGFSRANGRSRAQVFQGIVGIGAGVLTFIWPMITALVLVLFIGSWAIVTGILELVAAVRLRKAIHGEWLLALSGVMSIIFGLLVLMFPAAGAVGIAWILGVYAAAAGAVLITLGLRLRTQPLAAL
jgi:uncharacterized membrane protein HdeD (DUF308 family)